MENRFVINIGRIVSFLFLLTAVGCHRRSDVDKRMDLADNLMTSKPDSALAILEGIPVSDINGKVISARYALLKSMALDKNYIDTTTFEVLQPAIDYYIEHGTPDELLRTYYYQGRIYQNRGDNDAAMQSFMRGKEYCQEASDTLAMANLLVAQATIQYRIYKFDEFIKNNLEAANLYSAIGRADYELFSLVNALDGGILNNDKSLTDSIWTIAKQRVSENPDLSSIIVPYELSYVLKFGNRGDVIEILDNYESVDSINDGVKLNVAEAYYKTGDARNANRVLDAIPINSKFRTTLKYLALKPAILELNGDLPGALHAYKDYYATIDSIHMGVFSHDLLFAQSRHEMEKSNLIEKQRFDRLIWFILCIVFVLLIIIGFIYYRYRMGKVKSKIDAQEKQRLKIKQENLKRENENLELRRRQAELECERQSLVSENLRLKIEQLENESETLKEVLDKQKDLAKPIEDAIKIRIEMLNGLLASRITDNDSYAEPYATWKEQIIQDKDEFMNTTRLAFKASHPKFIDYLEQHGLTESEINYVCLYAIGLRGKEVGEYIQLKRHYHISSDIRKKLGIDEHQTNIGIYVRKLMRQL